MGGRSCGEETLGRHLELMASADAAPGGGSVAAVVVAMAGPLPTTPGRTGP